MPRPDVVRSSDDFVDARLASASALFDSLPDDVKSTCVRSDDPSLPVPANRVFHDAVKRHDFAAIGDALSALNEAVSDKTDDIGSSVVLDLIKRLVADAERAAATDAYADIAILFSGYLAELEKSGRSGHEGPTRTCVAMSRMLACIDDRAYGTARRTAANLADRLAKADDPDVRAWMIAGLIRVANALRRLAGKDAGATKG